MDPNSRRRSQTFIKHAGMVEKNRWRFWPGPLGSVGPNQTYASENGDIRQHVATFQRLLRSAKLKPDEAQGHVLLESLNPYWYAAVVYSVQFAVLKRKEVADIAKAISTISLHVERVKAHKMAAAPKQITFSDEKTSTRRSTVSSAATQAVSAMSATERFSYCYKNGLCNCCLEKGHRQKECECTKCGLRGKTVTTQSSAVATATQRYAPIVTLTNQTSVATQARKRTGSWSDNKRVGTPLPSRNTFAHTNSQSDYTKIVSPQLSSYRRCYCSFTGFWKWIS